MTEAVSVPDSGARMNPLSLLAGIPCAGVPFLLCVFGFGAYLRVSCIFSIPALIGVSFIVLYVCRAARNLKRGQYRTSPVNHGRDNILLLLFLGFSILSWCCGSQARIWHCESVCAQVDAGLDSMQKYQTEHGQFPPRLDDIPEFVRMTQDRHITVRLVRRGRDLPVYLFEHPDVIMYLDSGSFECVVPLEIPVFMSFTRFYVLRRTSESPGWTKTHFVWTISGI